MNHIQFGKFGEDLAEKYLKRIGYSVLEKNYRKNFAEIDIIAKIGEYLVFIEVKTRRSCYYGMPCEAVDYRKQKKITMLANNYINSKSLHFKQPRFDIIEVISNGRKSTINHIENAF